MGPGVSIGTSWERAPTASAPADVLARRRHLTLSGDVDGLADARRIAPIACVQNLYNLARRDDDPLIDACAEAGIAYVPFFPVGGFQPITAKHLDAVAARHHASVPRVALAWLLARSPNILLIPARALSGTWRRTFPPVR